MKPSFRGMACIIAMSLLSCGKNSGHENKEVSDIVETTTPVQNDLQTQAADTSTILQAGMPANADWDKKIIKTADITLQLTDYASFNNNIHKNIRAYGAYIASEKQVHSEFELKNIITVKVPVDQFEQLANSFSDSSVKIIEKNISTQDVSSEIVDIKARMEAKKQVRERYLELLKQAKNMKDILTVQQEINAIQEDIESAGGRAGYLSHQAAYSTINLTYYQLLKGPCEVSEPGFFSRLGEAFIKSLNSLEDFIVFLFYLWPLWIALLIGYQFFRKRRRIAVSKQNKTVQHSSAAGSI
ncbi:DUF4349 domain-containing protein [Filimonas effusa]|uniref:DUF4349 domain-containing protein n=1 Tax=Filimonas effusa TaxID=2508721 RepID=A0A4Q1DA57_9BACT|nr:DUF4349 domain-containing protein [Filimonas effusa]RXK86120.1 DUF4349 domain-containing protein [Filimonas effusa]